MRANEYLKKHNVTRVEDLSHQQLIDFAFECMNLTSQASVGLCVNGGPGGHPDPYPAELDAAIIKAYKNGLSVRASFIINESCNGPHDNYKSGLSISVGPEL